MLNAKKGRLLISEPSLKDTTFFKSVVLLTHHSDEESIGLILNQPTKLNLNEILSNIPCCDLPIYIGGPVEKNSIHFLHTLGNIVPETHEVIKGLYWGGQFDVILKLISEKKITKEKIRFFAGYSGWGGKQLSDEIIDKEWIINKANKNICMQYSCSELWSKLIKRQESKYAIWTNLPKNPNLN